MNAQQYSELARRTMNDLPYREAISNWLLGLCGEWGEFTETLTRRHLVTHLKNLGFDGELFEIKDSGAFETQELDAVSEAGDLLWYLNAICVTCGFSFPALVEYHQTNNQKYGQLGDQNVVIFVAHYGFLLIATLQEAVKKQVFHKGGELTYVQVLDKLADYVMAIAVSQTGKTIEKLFEANIAKLEQRHPTLRFDAGYHDK